MSDEIQNSIRTKELRLVDNAGNDRAVLGVGADGSVALNFIDQNSKVRTKIGVDETAHAQLELGHGEGRANLSISVGADGNVLVEGFDNEGVERFKLELRGTGSHTELSFHEKNRKPRMVLMSEDKGPAGLFIIDEHGRALFSTTP